MNDHHDWYTCRRLNDADEAKGAECPGCRIEELTLIIQAMDRTRGCGCCADYQREDEIFRLIKVMNLDDDDSEFWKKFDQLRDRYKVLSYEQENSP